MVVCVTRVCGVYYMMYIHHTYIHVHHSHTRTTVHVVPVHLDGGKYIHVVCTCMYITGHMYVSLTLVATLVKYVLTLCNSFATLARTTVFVRSIIPRSVRTIAKASVAVIKIVP